MRSHVTVRCRALALIGVALLCVVLAGLAAAGPASAAAPGPTLTVAELQTLLDNAPLHTVDGYFKTVLSGADIVQIPVTVTSIVPNSLPEGSLIFFQATGPAIDEIGGIAHGMSGSPLYVDDNGTDKLVGAVSYGDMFTKGNLGLATPVEYMSAMEDTFMPVTVPVALPTPVHADGRSISRVVVAQSARAARSVRPAAGTAVMAPLAEVAVAGLPKGSAAYKDMVAHFQKHGYDVAPYGAAVAGWDPGFSTDLVGGASFGMMMTRGDVLTGALGTVTYADGAHVVGFGHPLDGIGDVQYYLTNAWVEGVWASTVDPYKLMDPAKVRGTMTQDRIPGVAGIVSATSPPETEIDGTVTLAHPAKVGTAAAWAPRWVVADNGGWFVSDILAEAGYRATDAESMGGSGTTKTTIVVNDGTHDFTVVRDNTWDDPYDVLYSLPGDSEMMVDMLLADPDGIAPADIKSVKLEATVGTARDSARIAGVTVPGGFKVGGNTVDVMLYEYGEPVARHVSTTLTLPAGTPTSGALTVMAGQGVAGGGDDDSGDDHTARRAPAAEVVDDRESVADVIDDINALPKNTEFVLTYTPDSPDEPTPGVDLDPVVKTVSTDWVLNGDLGLHTGHVTMQLSPSTADYKAAVRVSGTIDETGGATTLDLYKKPVGASSETKLATVNAKPDGEGGATFAYTVTGLTKNGSIIARWGGDDVALGAWTSKSVKIRQRVSLTVQPTTVVHGGTTKLTASVLPGKPGQAVWFEQKVNGTWVLLKATKLTGSLKSTYSWKPPTGKSYVRARVPATSANETGVTPAVTVTGS